MAIGIIDLITTAVLHAQGRIVELNPIMRELIDRSEWLFALAKGATLFLGWLALRWYANTNLKFVRKASLWGSSAYLIVWCLWFFGAAAGHRSAPNIDVEPAAIEQKEDQAPPSVKMAVVQRPNVRFKI